MAKEKIDMGDHIGLTILWGLASFGLHGVFVASRERGEVPPSSPLREVVGMLIRPLGAGQWLFDDGARSLVAVLPEGTQPVLTTPVVLRGQARRIGDTDYLDVSTLMAI